ncbi:DNA polymerase III subunit alpha [Robertmurraya kyonggiensis]|uniref:DNA polymerase III subunit alpha n=1 Tax=Robertmurraya kyonggiensis TaxID=1037680 RepID=A0A4U1D137_9BACI|nr:DNA polymerase III subunit alpha [Robertmurraya kyonggiensis]TKC15784.1 DNA polymerase III subunit alpha [Robertmurraya kyonggiensis]
MSFVHLHVYSAYSLLSSTATIEELVQDAKRKGFKAIALTDQNVMYGTIAFYKACLKASIKPIIGLTVQVQSERKEEQSFPLVLLAQNQQGFYNLLKISSVVQTNSPSGIPMKWLRGYASGLIGITPGIKGEVEESLAAGDIEDATHCVHAYQRIFGKENFYLGIQNHGLRIEASVNEQLIELSQQLQIQLVATNEVHYLEKEDSFAHECLLSIKNGDKLQDESRERLESDQYYLKTSQEMVEIFTVLPDALENSLKIAEACNVMIELNQMNLPKYPTTGEKTTAELLEELCLKGFNERYTNPTEEHKTRLFYELEIIKKMKFADYFLIVWDFMKFSRENGILTGPGRGSAAGSMVAYVLYITDVDPIEYNLLFERFLNPERISMPDIDIDFPDHRRDEVIEYVSEKYGKLHVAQIITFGTLATKAVMRDVGRVFGLNPKELDQVSRLIPSRPGITLKKAIAESPELKKFTEDSSLNQRLFEVATKLEGLPRHTSTHAAGVVLTEKPLVESIPIQGGHNDIYLTQYTMDHLEEVGLLKMDFLGLRNLSLMESILDSIYRKIGKKLPIKELPFDDEETFKLLAKGETTGVFQLESDGMRSVLKRLKPTHFEDIVAVNALYRPGPMENIPLYIERKHGNEPVNYPHPDLKPILENTYGVIVYQEQIMQIAAKMAGFSLGEADLLRRAVSKKKKEVLDKEREHFVQGALNKGYDQVTANDIYDLIVKFANYGFNRSHAVAYSVIAYQLAYLKVHYPLFFMAALLSTVSGNEGKIVQYVREIKEMDISLLPPSINLSGYSFLVEKEGIRYSLAGIKGVGVAALKEIFQARKKRKFSDLFDFCMRVSSRAVNRKVLEALVHSGSFDEFGEDRAVLLASIDVAIEHAELVSPEELGDTDLFADEDGFFLKPKYTEVDPIGIEQKLQYEKEVLGFYLSDHPVSVYDEFLEPLGATALLAVSPQQKMVKSLVHITDVKKIRTKKGEEMAFLALSDQSGDLDGVVFPVVFKRFMLLLQKGNIVFIEGKIDFRDGKKQFVIQNVQDVNTAVDKVKNQQGTLYVRIEKERESSDLLNRLKELLKDYKGNVSVVLFYEKNERTIRLGKEDRITPSAECLSKLKALLGDSNVVLKG